MFLCPVKVKLYFYKTDEQYNYWSERQYKNKHAYGQNHKRAEVNELIILEMR